MRPKTLVRQETDAEVVQGLLDAYELLNDGGKHWGKGQWRWKEKGVTVSRCLIGGLNDTAPRGTGLNSRMVKALHGRAG
jgi:hypothetical protein